MKNLLAGKPISHATLVIPRAGLWVVTARVLDGEALDAGAATLLIGGAKLTGTVLPSDAPYASTGRYRMVAGGGWSKIIPGRAYRGTIGVRLADVVRDAASAAGEVVAEDLDLTATLGEAFLYRTCPAARVLDLACLKSGSTWYVDEEGKTHIGERPATTFRGSYVVIDRNTAARTLTIAAEDVSGLVPGATIEGLEIATVRHEVTESGIRSIIWGLGADDKDRNDAAAFKRLFDANAEPFFFHGNYRFTVLEASGGFLDLVPADTSTGLPELSNVPAYVGAPGAVVDPAPGSSVLVAFVDGRPWDPFVSHFEGPSGNGWIPTNAGLDALVDVKLGEALGRMLRSGDLVTIGGVQPGPGVTGVPLTLAPAVIALPGAPGIGRSKVLG